MYISTQWEIDFGIDKMDEYIKYFGLGEKTGVELVGEEKGTRPSREQIAKENREPNEKDILPEVPNIDEKQFKKEHIKAILEGMKAVTGERGGTAYSVFKNFNIEVGGKTGSAEVSETRTDGLFVGFAPFDDPEIGIVTVIENGVVGFHTSEVVLKIMQEYFGMNVTHVKENTQEVKEGEYIL